MTETITTSSLIEKFSYDESQQVLHIHFRKGGHYGYSNVTPEKFAAFREAESHGKFFLTEIKPHHQFSKYENAQS
jgi:hypothetical protein